METTATTSEEPATVEYSFEFRGNTGEFFKIWAVNMLLTLVTLGVFSAWAKVRTKRYFNGNIFLGGGNFDYHASPWSILFARVLVLGITGAVAYWSGEDFLRSAVRSTLLLVFLPWAYMRGLSFNARNTSFHGLRFSFRKTYFSIYLVCLPIIIGVLLTFYILSQSSKEEIAAYTSGDLYTIMFPIFFFLFILVYPIMIRALQRFKAQGHAYGGVYFNFNTPPVRHYYSPWGLFLKGNIVFVIIAVIFGIKSEWFFIVGLIGFNGFLIFYANALYLRLFWDKLTFPNGKVQCDFPVSQFALKVITVNFFAIIFSLGLLYPWAKIRRARYLAEHIKIIAPSGALQEVIAARSKKEGAMGEELTVVEGFDFDIGLI